MTPTSTDPLEQLLTATLVVLLALTGIAWLARAVA